MNFPTETAVRIRAAINDTISALRPAPGFPEPTRTALQAHLGYLLQREKALFTTEVRLDLKMDVSSLQERQATADTIVANSVLKPTPWYPDDSGEWVEGHPNTLPGKTLVSDFMYAFERENRNYTKPSTPCPAQNLAATTSIVAYKVVKP